MNALAAADLALQAAAEVRVLEASALIQTADAEKFGRLRGERPTIIIGNAIQATSSCGGLVGQLLATYFANDLAWATRVVKRESGCAPSAVNWREGCDTSGRTNSHAQGLFQMCVPLHDAIFASVGCSGNYLDAECNVRASRALYDAAGRGPWGG